jgi:hypothetical protein
MPRAKAIVRQIYDHIEARPELNIVEMVFQV